MSFERRSLRVVFSWFVLGMLAIGSPPALLAQIGAEPEDLEGSIESIEMMKHRARLELKSGLIIPINSKFDTAMPIVPENSVVGVKGAIEAIQHGMWLGLEFDFASMEVTNPGAVDPNTLPGQLQDLDTEYLMKSFDRYEVLLTWEYDVVLGDKIPTPEKGGWDLYSPIFRFGLGLGAVAINPKESDGNTLVKFDYQYMFVGRPMVSFRFPFHENFGIFLEAQYDFIPQIQMDGTYRPNDQNIEVGGKVDFSSFNLYFGISFEW